MTQLVTATTLAFAAPGAAFLILLASALRAWRENRHLTSAIDNMPQGTSSAVNVLSQVAGAATETRRSAETVLEASGAVDKALTNLRGEVETFLAAAAA